MFYTISLPKIHRSRVKVIPWKRAEVPKKEPQLLGYLSGAALMTALTQLQEAMRTPEAVPVMANSVKDSIQQKMIESLNPLIDLIQGLSYPVGFITVSCGMLLIMVGQRHKGLHLIKWASIGYIGMQFVPALMKILVDVGANMR